MTRRALILRLCNMSLLPRSVSDETELPDQGPTHQGFTRRDAVVILSSLVLTMAGCGGGGDTAGVTPPPAPPPPPPPPGGLTTITGSVSLPTGSALTPQTLSLNVMGQRVTPASTGAFSVGLSPIAPSMAIVTDSSGTGIMAAMLDPASNAVSITPRTTAVTLAWHALGGPFIPATVKSQALALLDADAHMDALGTLIGQRIVANPHAIVGGDSQIAAALNSAIDALVPRSIQRAAPALSRQDDAPLVTVTPLVHQGGVSVQADFTTAGIDLTNSFRRPVKVYVYEVQKDDNGTITDLVPAKLVTGPLDIDEPTRFTPMGGLISLLGSGDPYDPVLLGPLPLALDGSALTTTFEVVVIGPSANGVIPSFFGAARYAPYVAGWNSAIETMFARTYFVDMVYALLLELSGFSSLLPTAPGLVTAGPNTRAVVGWPWTGTATKPAVPEDVADLVRLVHAVLDGGTINGATLDDIYLNTAPSLMDSASAAALRLINKVDWQASLRTGDAFVSKLRDPLSGAKANGALSKLFDDLAEADRGVLWTVTVSKSTVTILPPDPTGEAGTPLTLSTVLSADLKGAYEYEWTQDSTTGTMSASDAQGTTTLTTKDASITLTPGAQQTAPINVTVTVVDVGTPGRRPRVSGTSVQVLILRKATIVPSSVALRDGQQQTFTVTVDGGALPSGVKYLWNVVGQSGTIGVGAVTTATPSISYTALNKGTDTLKVQVVDANNKLIARTSAVITVDPDSLVDFTISGSWDREKTPANGHYSYGDVDAIRSPAPVPNLDWLAIAANIAPPDSTLGVLISVFVPPSWVFADGQTFPRTVGIDVPLPGTFQLTLSQDQSDVQGSQQYAPAGAGTLRMDSAHKGSDNKWHGQMSFTISNGSGTIVGTCSAVWP